MVKPIIQIKIAESVAEKAYRLLKDIPENEWITDHFSDSSTRQCCAIGHYQRLKSSDPTNYTLQNCRDIFNNCDLRRTSARYLQSVGRTSTSIAEVNNNEVPEYNQPTTKGRVMAFLKDMIKAGY